MEYYKFNCGCIESVEKVGNLFHWKDIIVCGGIGHKEICEATHVGGPDSYSAHSKQISKLEAAILKLKEIG